VKLFFLGGSFDPPHLGHLAIVEKCVGRYDKFLYVPAKCSPHKTNSPIADDAQRLQMLELMAAEVPLCSIDTFELNVPAPSYTLATIRHLLQTYPKTEISMLIGFDQLANFDKWYHYQAILELVKVICFHRTGHTNIPPAISFDFEMIEDFQWNQSSTAVRKKFKSGDPSVADDLHPLVYRYIIEQKIYS